MTPPSFEVDEDVIGDSLKRNRLITRLQVNQTVLTFSTVLRSLFMYSGWEWTNLLGWSEQSFSRIHWENGPTMRIGLKGRVNDFDFNQNTDLIRLKTYNQHEAALTASLIPN